MLAFGRKRRRIVSGVRDSRSLLVYIPSNHYGDSRPLCRHGYLLFWLTTHFPKGPPTVYVKTLGSMYCQTWVVVSKYQLVYYHELLRSLIEIHGI